MFPIPPAYRHGYRRDIDGLRAVAVLSVVLFHAGISPFSGGFVGVDVFFVISGYLITRNIMVDLTRNCFSFSEFFIRRACRLLPVSFFVTAVTSIVGYIMLPASMLGNLGKSAAFSLLSASNFFFWRDVGYFALGEEYKPLLHTWSLGVEEQFYLIYPLFLLTLTMICGRSRHKIILVGLGIMISTVLAQYVVTQGHANAAFYLMPFRAGEFGLGVLAALVPPLRNPPRAVEEGFFALGALLVILSVVLYTDAMPFPGWSALLPCVGAALMIISGESTLLAKPFRSTPVVSIGIISYSLYLVHWPVLTFYNFVARYSVPLVQRLGIVAICILLATLLFAYIERPFRLAPARLTSDRIRRSAYALVLILVVCQVLAFAEWRLWGAEWRYSQLALKAIQESETAPGAECRSGFNAGELPNMRCVSSEHHSGKKALLLGESHSEHWRPALAAVLPGLGFSLDHFGGCVPIPNVTKYTDGGEDRRCRRYAGQLEKMIDGYDLIILGARWSLYTETTTGVMKKGTAAHTYVLSDGDGSALTEAGAKAVFKEHFGRFIQALATKGKHVLVFGQVPELGIDLRPCIGRPDWRGLLPNERCVPFYSRKAALARLAFTNQEISRTVQGMPKMTVFWPTKYICPEDREYCATRLSGIWLYRDDNHLNAYGAIALIPAVKATLEALLSDK